MGHRLIQKSLHPKSPQKSPLLGLQDAREMGHPVHLQHNLLRGASVAADQG